MKKLLALTFVAASFVTGLSAALWSKGQTTRVSQTKPDSYLELRQFESLVLYLQETRQTNALQKFVEFSNTTIATRESAQLGVMVAVLQRLKAGRTNEAFEILEGQANSAILGFVTAYRDLPSDVREKLSLKALDYCRDYRAQHPYKSAEPQTDRSVNEAFKALDEFHTATH